jgi:hypothetical protein
MIEPPIVPSLSIPKPPDLPAPVLEIPKAELPSYRPVFIPPAASADTLPVQVETPAKRAEPERETQQNLQQLVKEALRQAQAAPSVRRVAPSVQAVPEPSAAEVTTVVVPGTNVKIPVPKAEILSAAATTSVISVGATLAATSMFKRLVQIFKPTFKAVAARIQKLRGKPVQTWARQRLSERHRRRQAQRVNRRGS